MAIGDERFGPIGAVRPREAAGMCELQADDKIVGGVGAEALAMRGEQLVAQAPRARAQCDR